MKKLFLVLCSTFFLANIFANSPIVNEKVLKSFDQTFTNPEAVKWEEYQTHYSVSFVNAGIQSKINYDKEGNILGSIRYYAPQMLPLHVFNKLKKEYSNDTLFGVTEVIYDNAVTYFVKIETAKHWITLKVDASGDGEVVQKYKKG